MTQIISFFLAITLSKLHHLSLIFFHCLLDLPFVSLLEMICRRSVVGSYRRILEEYAEVLGEVRVLDHVETLILIQLTALGKSCRVTHPQEL